MLEKCWTLAGWTRMIRGLIPELRSSGCPRCLAIAAPLPRVPVWPPAASDAPHGIFRCRLSAQRIERQPKLLEFGFESIVKHGILLVLSLSVIALSALLPSLSGCGSKDVATGEHPGPLEIIVVDDASGEPVADLRVAVTTASGEPWSLETTGADGRVAWERGVRGEVTVLAMDTLGRYVETRIEGAGSGQHEFRIQRGSVLRFTVESADGRAIAPAITLWSPDQPRGRHVPAAGAAAAQTVTLSPVAPGQAKLLVTADGYVAQALDVLVGRGETDLGRVVLAPGGLAVEGRVSDSLEPRPTIAYFRFRGAGLSVPIDASGRFQFRGLPPTSGTLVFRRDGRELFARSVDIGDSDVDLGVVAPRR